MLLLLGTACNTAETAELYPTTAFEPNVLAELHEIRDEIAETRGLTLNPDVQEGWMSSGDYGDYIGAEYDDIDSDDLQEINRGDTLLKLLGILEEEDSLYEQSRDISSNQIAGFYSFDTDQLVLVGGGGSLSRFERSTIAHEYVHSFQEILTVRNMWDERFYVDSGDKFFLRSFDDATLDCVIEGDASFAESLYTGESLEDLELYAEYMTWMERNFYFNYSTCVEFIASVHEHGGWAAVNKLYQDPPFSIEQVMHPEKYFSEEMPTAIEPVYLDQELSDWEQFSGEIFNEFDVWNLVFELTGSVDLAGSAASGWGMGWIGFYKPEDGDDGVLGHISIEFDTPADFDDFSGAMAVMVEELGGNEDSWENESGSGRVTWDAGANRFDIIVSTDVEALESAYEVLDGAPSKAAARP